MEPLSGVAGPQAVRPRRFALIPEIQFTVASELLDMNGILFGIQLVVLLFLGPYADYGSWRPYVLIGESGTYSALMHETQSRPSCCGSPLWPSPV